jgi:hypothetical protein
MSTAESEEKGCTGCERVLAASFYYAGASKCKVCTLSLLALKRAADRMDSDTSAPDDQEPTKRSKFFEATVAGADLYIMAISTDPTGEFHGLKVGRSGNVPQRAASLSESLPFNILVLTTLTNMGHLEKHIHARLDPTRNATGRGREWFHASLPTILHTVACLLQSHPKVNAGSTGTAPVAPPAE